MADIQTPHDLIRAYQHQNKKRFGQHFLSDPSILESIVEAAGIEEGDRVLEIGPGCGTLTWALLKAGARVRAIEIDTQAAAFVREQLGGGAEGELTVVQGDALARDLSEELGEEGPWRCVANLPYNVATPILFALTEHRARFACLVLMFQREVAQRMVATPAQRADYGVLALMTRLYYAEARIETVLPPGAFYPPPKVHSALVVLEPLPQTRLPDPEQRARFERIVKAGFGQRRKTLPNGLKSAGYDKARAREAMEQLGLDPRARAETLDFETFAELARLLGDPSQK